MVRKKILRQKIHRFFQGVFILSAASLVLAEPIMVRAEIKTSPDGSTTFIYDGDSDDRSGGSRDSTTESSSGGGGGSSSYSAPVRSREYYAALNARSGLDASLFNGAIVKAKNSSMFGNAVMFNGDIIRLGEGSIGRDRLNLIDDLIKQFDENYGQLDGWERSTSDGSGILMDKSLSSVLPGIGLTEADADEISKLFYMSLMGNEKFPGGAGTFDFDSYVGGLDMGKLLGGGLGGLGFDFGDMDFPSFEEWMNGQDGKQIRLGGGNRELYSDVLGMLKRKGNGFSFEAGDIHGLREDLFSGGLDGYSSFIKSIKAFRDVHREIFDRNSDMDSVNVLYLEDNHITSVDATEYYNVSFTSDKRLWSVYNEKGKLVKQVETENEDHKYIFQGFPEGHYTVVAQQWADYQITKNFYYQKYEYLIDTATKTMLWARRSGTNMIRLKNLRQSGYRPNGKTFKVHVNKHGEVENETRVSERIE